MRIGLISHEYPPETGWGGIATFAYNLSHGLKELGHDVEVVSLAVDHNKQTVQEGIKVHRVLPYDFAGDFDIVNLCMPYSHSVLRTTSALWNKLLQLHKDKPFEIIDVPELLAQGIYPGLTKIAPLVIRLYTPHSKFIAERFHNVTPSFDHELIAAFERMAMLSADALTSPSNNLAQYVANDLNIRQDQIHIICNPIDPEKFSPSGNKAITPDGRLTVLFVGRLEERKGIHYLIDAIPSVIKSYPNVRFVIIGDDTKTGIGYTSVLSELKRSLHASACQDHVIWINRVALHELPAYYRSADICVVPSVYDNSPYTCLEAMSCARPVIGTTGGGMADYITEAESGRLVAPRDRQALSKVIIELLTDQQQRLLLGDNARARVLDKFHSLEIARQTVELYKVAINSASAHSNLTLYLKSPEQALPDIEELVYAFHKAIGNFLYVHSWRFRFRHWYNLRRRPRLFIGKLYMRMASLFYKIIGKQQIPAKLIKLQEEIELKQDALRYHKLLNNCETESDDREKMPVS